jgi:hypothetical protein
MRSTRLSGNRHQASATPLCAVVRRLCTHPQASRETLPAATPATAVRPRRSCRTTPVRPGSEPSIRSAVSYLGAPTSRRGLSATKVTSDFPRAGRTRSSTATRMCRCFPTSVLDRTVARQPGLHNRRHQRPRQDARHSNCHCRCRECSGTAHWREPLCRCGRATRTRRGRHRPGQGDLRPSARRLLARWPTSGSGEPPSLYLMATVLAEDWRV